MQVAFSSCSWVCLFSIKLLLEIWYVFRVLSFYFLLWLQAFMWILLLFYLKVKLIIVRGKLHMIKSLFYSSKIKGLNKTTRLGFFFCHFIIYLAQIFYRCGMFFLLWKKLIHELNFLGCWFKLVTIRSKPWFSKNRIT